MSNCITIYNSISAPGTLDMTMNLEQPLVLPRGGEVRVQCANVEISDLIPNIFDGTPYGQSWNNTKLRVRTDVEAWTTIQLDMGRYDSPQLEAALNAAINSLGWWLDPAMPGLKVMGNTVIQRIVFVIDDTKLDPVHGTTLSIDFRKATTGSDLYYSLGFPINSMLVGTGVYSSPNLPMMETQGTACVIECNVSELRRYHDGFRRILAEVPFSDKSTFGNSVWPQGAQISPDMIYSGPRTINKINVAVKTREGSPMIFMGGIINVTIRFL